MRWFWLLLAIICSNLGNLLVKSAGTSIAVGFGGYLSPSFLAGVATFGLGLLFYARAVAVLPLAVATLVLIGATVTGTTVIAICTFHERISFLNVAGIALILSGLVCLVASMSPKVG